MTSVKFKSHPKEPLCTHPRILHLLCQNIEHIDLITIDGIADSILKFGLVLSASTHIIIVSMILATLLTIGPVHSGKAHSRIGVNACSMLQQELDTLLITLQTGNVQRQRTRTSIDIGTMTMQQKFGQFNVI